MTKLSAIYDASVLYPAPVRDLLLQLAFSNLCRAHWTNDIHDEWIRNLLQNRPDLTSGQLQRTRELMNAGVRDCLVENYSALIPSLDLPDSDDRHVLAAAIVAQVDLIITYNLRDFPRRNLKTHGIEAQHPDKFIGGLLNIDPTRVYSVVATIRARLRNPPMSPSEYIDTLEQHSLPRTANLLRPFKGHI